MPNVNVTYIFFLFFFCQIVNAVGYGIKSVKDIKVMERAQPLSDHRLAIDAVIAISIRSISVKLKYFLTDKFYFCDEELLKSVVDFTHTRLSLSNFLSLL